MNLRMPRSRLLLAAPILALTGMCPSPVRSVADEPTARPLSFPVTISVDAARERGPLQPVWRFFGADEPNYAYMKHGRELIGELGDLRPGSTYFRTHNLLTSGDGTPALKWGSTGVYREDKDGRPIYDWTIVDRIFDTYLERGVKPYVQIGFMPKELSVKPEPYQHHWGSGQATARSSRGGLIRPRTTRNGASWSTSGPGTASRNLAAPRLSRGTGRHGTKPTSATGKAPPENSTSYTIMPLPAFGVPCPRRGSAAPTLPGSGGRWTRDFLDHCLHGTNYATGKIGTPLDFVSFHAKGSPQFVDGHVRMGIANQLRVIDDGFRHCRLVSRTEGQADRDRRIRSRGAAPPVGARNSAIATARCIPAIRQRASPASTTLPSGRREPRRCVDLGF